MGIGVMRWLPDGYHCSILSFVSPGRHTGPEIRFLQKKCRCISCQQRRRKVWRLLRHEQMSIHLRQSIKGQRNHRWCVWVTYRSLGKELRLRMWMAQKQLHHPKAHLSMGNESQKLHFWNSLHNLQAAQPKSPLPRHCCCLYNLREGLCDSRNFQELSEPGEFYFLSFLSLPKHSRKDCFILRQ